MKRIATVVCILGGATLTALGVRVAMDKVALEHSFRALADQDPAIREDAARAVREIAARYPSGTVNFLEWDGGAARWARRVATLTPGMPETEVVRRLDPIGIARVPEAVPPLQNFYRTYQLDRHWAVTIEYQKSGAKTGGEPTVLRTQAPHARPQAIRVAPASPFTGIWTQYSANGEKHDDTTLEAGRIVHVERYWERGPPAVR